MQFTSKELYLGVLLLLVAAICSILLGQGVSGNFYLDDFSHLSPLASHGGVTSHQDFLRYVFGESGLQFDRLLARISFVVDDQFWPTSAHGYKETNIALHLVAGLLMFLVLFRLDCDRGGQRYTVAFYAACIWMIFPIHVSTVLYVVQRMTQLSFIFLLLSVYLYLMARTAKGARECVFALLGASVAAIFSLLSKPSGLAVFLIIPLLEYYCNVKMFRPWRPQLFRGLAVICLVVYVAIYIGVVAGKWSSFESRTFTPLERLGSQGPILFEYLSMLVSGLGGFTLFHDNKEVELAQQSIWFTGLAWLLHLCIISMAIKKFRAWPLLCFGLLWFYLGHVLESTLLPLELMYEHRNYMPAFGCALVLAFVLEKLCCVFSSRGLGAVSHSGFVCLIGLYAILLYYNASLWGNHRIITSKWAAERTNSLRSQIVFSSMLEQMGGFQLMALNKLRAVDQEFDSPSIKLMIVRLECQLGDGDFMLEPDIYAKGSFDSAIIYNLVALLKLKDRECVETKVMGGLDALISAIDEAPALTRKPKYKALYYSAVSDYYIGGGMYREALQAREMLVEVQPSIATHLKLAELYILGGDLVRAGRTLQKTYALNRARWYRDDAVRADIDNLQYIVDGLAANNRSE